MRTGGSGPERVVGQHRRWLRRRCMRAGHLLAVQIRGDPTPEGPGRTIHRSIQEDARPAVEDGRPGTAAEHEILYAGEVRGEGESTAEAWAINESITLRFNA